MEHLLGMIADIASSVWQFALNLPGALQIVFTLVALIAAGVCRMVAIRLSHPAFTETDGSAVGKIIIQVIAYILMVVCLLACLLGLAAVFAPLIGLA